ncbi:MAG: GNAT family N-acetyltransferase [Prevotellaceae bacterium]|jgi:predicted GNAT family N-acyltransferase|nr:GNAT family N-acetyltransferase [Prevotellaceae bacterium]
MEKLNPRYKIVDNLNDLQKAFFVRGVVFVEGQNCAYSEDCDGLDFAAVHFLCTVNDEPVAAARIRILKDYVKIERLAVRQQYRGKNIGTGLFAFILDHINQLGYTKTVIHAQSYLLNFYEKFGFVKQGEKFIEANIEHYYMELYVNKLDVES